MKIGGKMSAKIDNLCISERVIKILCDVLQRLPNEISPEMTLFDEMGIESVEILEIVFVLEREFGFKLEENDLWNLPNYLLEKKLFSNGVFSEAAICLIEENIKNLSIEKIGQINSSHALVNFITISDLINCITKRIKKNI